MSDVFQQTVICRHLGLILLLYLLFGINPLLRTRSFRTAAIVAAILLFHWVFVVQSRKLRLDQWSQVARVLNNPTTILDQIRRSTSGCSQCVRSGHRLVLKLQDPSNMLRLLPHLLYFRLVPLLFHILVLRQDFFEGALPVCLSWLQSLVHLKV